MKIGSLAVSDNVTPFRLAFGFSLSTTLKTTFLSAFSGANTWTPLRVLGFLGNTAIALWVCSPTLDNVTFVSDPLASSQRNFIPPGKWTSACDSTTGLPDLSCLPAVFRYSFGSPDLLFKSTVLGVFSTTTSTTLYFIRYVALFLPSEILNLATWSPSVCVSATVPVDRFVIYFLASELPSFPVWAV